MAALGRTIFRPVADRPRALAGLRRSPAAKRAAAQGKQRGDEARERLRQMKATAGAGTQVTQLALAGDGQAGGAQT